MLDGRAVEGAPACDGEGLIVVVVYWAVVDGAVDEGAVDDGTVNEDDVADGEIADNASGLLVGLRNMADGEPSAPAGNARGAGIALYSSSSVGTESVAETGRTRGSQIVGAL